MAISRQGMYKAALVVLWALACGVIWLMITQAFVMRISAPGTWRWPRIYQVTVVQIVQDELDMFADKPLVNDGHHDRAIHLPKAECRDLKPGDEIWVLDNYYATPVRPEQFRLSLRRLLVEFPEPLLLLFLVGIWRVRKALAKAQRDVPPPTVFFKDDFHRRADRFDASNAPKA